MKKDKEYRRKRSVIWRKYSDKRYFGGMRDVVLERDGWTCLHCGMSQEQHFVLFNRRLTVDHIDGNGRNSDKPNNSLDNLQTLCLRCHGRKDIKRIKNQPSKERSGASKLTQKQVDMIRKIHSKGKTTQTKLGKDFGVCSTTIHQLLHRRTWK